MWHGRLKRNTVSVLHFLNLPGLCSSEGEGGVLEKGANQWTSEPIENGEALV